MLNFLFFVNNASMKKLIVFMVLVLFVTLTAFVKNKENPLFDCDNVEKVCVITENSGASGENVIDCGNKDFVYLSKEDGKKFVCSNKVAGLQFYIENMELNDLLNLLNADIIDTQYVENIQVVYAYSPYYQGNVVMENKKVNLQIALKGDEIIAGFPLILTGF